MTNRALNAVDRRTDPLPAVFHKYRPYIGAALRTGLADEDAHVYDMLRYFMGWVDVDGKPTEATQGKALRPTLCLLACEATGGSIGKALPAAVALEFIHSFSLIHDDIQDGDETRHHRATLWAVWGVPKAILAGNILRAVADMSLTRLVEGGVSVQDALTVTRELTQGYLQMIEGQYLDLSYESRHDLGLDDYLGMISLKTGALIRCATHIGAIIGTGDPATARAFRQCGRSLGFVFQIRDDVLGVWGEEETTGKPVGADIRRRKNSFPVVYAMSVADGADKRALLEIYQDEGVSDGDVDQVLDILERVGAKEHAEDLTARHARDALDALDGVKLAPQVRDDLVQLTEFLQVRQH